MLPPGLYRWVAPALRDGRGSQPGPGARQRPRAGVAPALRDGRGSQRLGSQRNYGRTRRGARPPGRARIATGEGSPTRPPPRVAPALRDGRGSQRSCGCGTERPAASGARPPGRARIATRGLAGRTPAVSGVAPALRDGRGSQLPDLQPHALEDLGGARPPGRARIATTMPGGWIAAPSEGWRPPSGTGEDRNCEVWWLWVAVCRVAPALRDGRGSQLRWLRRYSRGRGRWRPPSGTGEDRNVQCTAAETAAMSWRPPSGTGEVSTPFEN